MLIGLSRTVQLVNNDSKECHVQKCPDTIYLGQSNSSIMILKNAMYKHVQTRFYLGQSYSSIMILKNAMYKNVQTRFYQYKGGEQLLKGSPSGMHIYIYIYKLTCYYEHPFIKTSMLCVSSTEFQRRSISNHIIHA